jgi:excinuclease ABC subunit A
LQELHSSDRLPAAKLGRTNTGKTLYVLDEPTTGLRFDDVRQLLVMLDRLVDLGNNVIVIGHHLDVKKSADWLIDPGGQILASGTPEDIAANDANATGRYLQPLLASGHR